MKAAERNFRRQTERVPRLLFVNVRLCAEADESYFVHVREADGEDRFASSDIL